MGGAEVREKSKKKELNIEGKERKKEKKDGTERSRRRTPEYVFMHQARRSHYGISSRLETFAKNAGVNDHQLHFSFGIFHNGFSSFLYVKQRKRPKPRFVALRMFRKRGSR